MMLLEIFGRIMLSHTYINKFIQFSNQKMGYVKILTGDNLERLSHQSPVQLVVGDLVVNWIEIVYTAFHQDFFMDYLFFEKMVYIRMI